MTGSREWLGPELPATGRQYKAGGLSVCVWDPEEPAKGGPRQGRALARRSTRAVAAAAVTTTTKCNSNKVWGLGRWAPKGPPGREGPYSHPPAHAGAQLGCQRLLGLLELGVWGVKTVLASQPAS